MLLKKFGHGFLNEKDSFIFLGWKNILSFILKHVITDRNTKKTFVLWAQAKHSRAQIFSAYKKCVTGDSV
jgi:IS1 family transposase